ncbi:MAG: YebC/PmpR family DNA-binding transcriptional regulator [Candidatus Pacebacteria bacterium]|nr:YebC/PmpR family DNA-binding transcriptional regulator [Candidatus Paceibacterota bacterium]MBP9840084.1 YebC/PmpR family DNA-binding transcriptional regulator [Candidatus Paceibacterota bacterium]
MAGHSKWAQIKRGKAVTDAARSRVFSKFAREIALESKKAGGSLSSPGLAAVIARAKAANMPKDNIDRAVTKGTSKDAGELDQLVYECYGPAGVAIVVDALTDSRNRTTQEIKHLMSKNDVELLVPGAASWAFTASPNNDGSRFTPNEPLTEITGDDEEKLQTLLSALDEHDDVQAVYTNARGYESTYESAGN